MSNIEDRKPVAVLAERVWSGSSWHYPHINEMIAELTRLRTENAAFRRNEDDVLDMAKEAGYSTPHGESDSTGEAVSWMAEQLERLRAIEKAAREAGFLDADGNVRRVLGTLPLTADGCVIGDEAVVVDLWGDVHIVYASHEDPIFSTTQAAEAARGGGK